jgi:ribosome-associated toxin RatA of RatAB toxin-antitoxin module
MLFILGQRGRIGRCLVDSLVVAVERGTILYNGHGKQMMIESIVRSAPSSTMMMRCCCKSMAAVAIKQQHYKSSTFRYQKNRCIGAARSATTHNHVHKSTLTNIHPQHLYHIVNNVDNYKDFLPYCHESKILQTSPCGTMYDAVLRVGLPGLSGSNSSLLEERYVSRVRMIPANETTPFWTIEAKSIQSNLFDSLKSRWQLSLIDDNANGQQQTGPSCNVNFEVQIQVSNSLISFTLDRVLKDVAKAQVEAFEKRCRAVPSVDNKSKKL